MEDGALLTAACAMLAAIGVATLLAVDAVSWARLGPVRRGRLPHGAATTPWVGGRTGPATRLAWATALLAAAAGAGAAAGGEPWGWPVAGAGSLIAVAGVRGRVLAVWAGPEALVVWFRGARRIRLPWPRCTELRPPRGPFGGWRVRGSQGSVVLMPTDVLGRERDVLAALIVRAGLRFDGRRWRRVAPGGTEVSP